MGRKRKKEDEKKKRVQISITKKLHDDVKKQKINLSEFVENALKNFLNR